MSNCTWHICLDYIYTDLVFCCYRFPKKKKKMDRLPGEEITFKHLTRKIETRSNRLVRVSLAFLFQMIFICSSHHYFLSLISSFSFFFSCSSLFLPLFNNNLVIVRKKNQSISSIQIFSLCFSS